MADESNEAETPVEASIRMLKTCNDAHLEMIARLEHYQRCVDGFNHPAEESTSGYSNGYAAELLYLHARRSALDATIASVERYRQLAGDPSAGIELQG